MKRSFSEIELSQGDHDACRKNERRVSSSALLLSWIDADKPNYGFTSEVKNRLLKSLATDAKNVLQFTLEFVFNWRFTNKNENENKPSIDDRHKMLEFVTDWLASDPDHTTNHKVPSLLRLCAQQFAMDLFHRFVPNIDLNFTRKELSYFTEILNQDLASELEKIGVASFLHNHVAEEVYIFTMVYLLYVDIREYEPHCTSRSDPLIPISADYYNALYGPDWWIHCALDIVDIVKDVGKGSLAKAGLLPFSAFKRWKSKWALDIIAKMIYDCERGSLKIQHPSASSIAHGPIMATIYFYCLKSGALSECWKDGLECAGDIIEKKLLPWAKLPGIIYKDRNSLYPTMVRISTSRRILDFLYERQPLQRMHEAMRNELTQPVVDAFRVVKVYGLPPKFKEGVPSQSDDMIVPNIRFNGNFSKFDLLSKVMSLGGIRTLALDLEDCVNLDDECLGAIFRWVRPRFAYLKGTPFSKDSPVLKKINQIVDSKYDPGASYYKRQNRNGISFFFTRHDSNSISFFFVPRVTVNKLERSNRSLVQQNNAMQEEIEKLKNKIQELERKKCA
ncbi:predicted protein [Chaetoceros tenuissimus]|uniref:Uncharacterized protein n=1 Tax=Chaetoceros tenuissimus TaxID=426638 RepID=A0AAD3CIJ7_9STRA|nr:predicted protein [Chaetoceros tenuissimus]